MFHHVAVAFGIDAGPVFFLDYDNLCTGLQQGDCVFLLAQAVLPFPVWKHRDQLQLWIFILQLQNNLRKVLIHAVRKAGQKDSKAMGPYR